LLERHARFPDGTNVQVARIDGLVASRRGSGSAAWVETSSSGTSAVAVAAATQGEGETSVTFPGGTLRVTISGGQGLSYRPWSACRDRHLPGACPETVTNPRPCSRSAALRLTPQVVEASRQPMIKRAGEVERPGRKFFGLVPGTTIARGGT